MPIDPVLTAAWPAPLVPSDLLRMELWFAALARRPLEHDLMCLAFASLDRVRVRERA